MKARPRYIECGCCGHYHRAEYGGDCRNDAERFTTDQIDALERQHGPQGIEIIHPDDDPELRDR